MTRRFTVQTDPDGELMAGRSFELDVVVHANAAAMRRAVRRYDPNGGGDISRSAACFTTPRHGHGRGRSFLGTVRFSEEHINALVVIHEAVHAGVALAARYAQHRRYRLVLAPFSDDDWAVECEERTAYASTEFALAMLVALGLGDPQEPAPEAAVSATTEEIPT